MADNEHCVICNSDDIEDIMPEIGLICKPCWRKLSQPTRLEGCVPGPSIEHLAFAMRDEFARRRQRLIEAAWSACSGR